MLRFILILLLFSASSALFSQTFSGVGGDIPDDGTTTDFPIEISGLAPGIIDTSLFGLESVCFNIVHAWTADLSVSLVAPDGTVIPLVNGVGGDTDGYVNTCLSNNSTESIYQAWYPFTGTFRPFGELGRINNGQNANGTWKLRILDTYAFADAGSLLDWSITFGNQPCKPFPFFSSDLPIVKILTNNQVIPNEPKINGSLIYIDNGPGQRNFPNQTTGMFSVPIGIELHGNSSLGFPKKNYRIETRDDLGEDLDVTFPGLAPTSDYVLHGSFSDKTQIRNPLTYNLFRKMGHYATRTRFCELVIDDAYLGTYVITERIKRGKDLVDIARLKDTDIEGVDLTGGYIMKIDWNTTPGWNSMFTQPNSQEYTYFQHVYPNWDVMQPEQIDYIRGYVDSFEIALAGPDFRDPETGWRHFADEKSFLDYLIINELSKNVDGYRLSTYFYKDRDDAAIKGLQMGPTWDHDLSWYNADYCEGFSQSGWAYNINYICGAPGAPFWWERLFEDSLFTQNLSCRWQSLREGILKTEHLFALVDSMAGVLQESQDRNFRIWPILGTYVWPNPGPLPDTYAGEITQLKNWVTGRLEWLDYTCQSYAPVLNPEFEAQPLDAFNWQFTAGMQGNYEYFWDFGDGTFAETASPLHQFANTGTYKVKLYLSTPYGCQQASQQILHIVNTGTSGPLQAGQAHIFPNPVSNTYRIELPIEIQGPVLLQWIDGAGRICYSEQVSTPLQFNTPELPSGMYQVRIQHALGNWQQKVVKR
jgi:subtilisin-like proprotein convertase family protein